jgi:serine/threonine protein kinase
MDSDVFATLTPIESAAKRAFSDVAACCMAQPPPYWKKYMHINPIPVYDHEDARDLERNEFAFGIDDSEGASTSADEGTVSRRKDLYTLWTGCYIFKLSEDGRWIAGKGRPRSQLPGEGVQFKLMHERIRGMHVRFFLSDVGFIGIVPFSAAAQGFTFDGVPVRREARFFNKSSSVVTIGSLHFEFTYTEYSRSEEFLRLRNQFCSQAKSWKDQDASTAALNLTPTPAQQTQSIGQWILSKELGKGAVGKVYSATNSSGDVVAIKVVERNKMSTEAVWTEINNMKSLTQEAKKDACKHVSLLEEVIGDMTSEITAAFRDIALVLKPAAYYTLGSIIIGNEPQSVRMALFEQVLHGLNFLHSRGWVHRDVKPPNIGVYEHGAVLLDFGNAIRIYSPAKFLNPAPGRSGTIGFLAPEQEMKQYDFGVDIWAAGIILYMLLLGNNPLKMSYNPWREEYKHSRKLFHQKYQEMLSKLRNTCKNSDICDLTEKMLRFEWAEMNIGTRIGVHEALDHAVWKSKDEVDGNDRPTKFARWQACLPSA